MRGYISMRYDRYTMTRTRTDDWKPWKCLNSTKKNYQRLENAWKMRYLAKSTWRSVNFDKWCILENTTDHRDVLLFMYYVIVSCKQVQWLKLSAWTVGDRGFEPHSGLLLTRKKINIVGSLRDREVVSSASDRQGSNFESCVRRALSSHRSHHPQKILLAQLSLYVHNGWPKTSFMM